MTRQTLTNWDNFEPKEYKEYFNGQLIITKRYNRNGLITYKKNAHEMELQIKYLKASVNMLFAGDILYTYTLTKENVLAETKYYRGDLEYRVPSILNNLKTLITEIQKDHA